MRLSPRLFLAVMMLVCIVTPLRVLQAQNTDTTTLTLAVPAFTRDAYTDKMIGEFEAANAGVKVNIVEQDVSVPDPTLGLDNHFDQLQKFVSTADVVYIDENSLSVEGTRAGYFLDLTPLVNEDKSLKPEEFYPAFWQSYQWDQGIWALPVAANAIVMTYDPAAFDKAGLAYPTEKWTFDDLANAVNKLAQKDSTGKVVQHGLDINSNYATVVLFRSLLGEGLYDSSSAPNAPKMDKPNVEAFMDAWTKLYGDGLIGSGTTAPLSIGAATGAVFQNALNTDKKLVSLLLPGGKGGLDVQGYAISKGTQYPDKAYALAAFLTTRAEVIGPFAGTPARKTLLGTDNGTGISLKIPAETQKVIDQAVENGRPVSEVRFANYLSLAQQKMLTQKEDSTTALQEVEITATNNLQAAADKKDKVTIVVATPIPGNDTSTGKASLNFGILSFQRPLPQLDKWNKLVADFTSSDPQIGSIKLDTPAGFNNGTEQLAEKYDCFYLPYNAVPSVQLSALLNLDPFMAADKTFDKSDVVGNVLTQLTRDNKVWGLPVIIEPSLLKYDAQQFDKAAASQPASGWTVDQFNDALKVLKPDDKTSPPFIASGTGGTHLLILIAAYGGLPLDFRTDPPTFNYSDPKTLDAIKQVLDLAKKGYIKYDELGKIGFNFGLGGTPVAPIMNQALNLFNFGGNNNAAQANTYKPVAYPTGNTFNAVSYSIGSLYISAKTQNAEGCYRWISTIAKNPDLFSAMPAYRSLINDPARANTQGASVVALYNQIDKLLQESNTISIPSLFAGGGSGAQTGALYQFWMFRAFDGYILRDSDLEAGLQDAEAMSKALQGCVDTLPPYDPTSNDSRTQYFKGYANCIVKIDPTFAPLFSLINIK